MITRADVEIELAKYHTQADQITHLLHFLKSKLPADPVVNGPLRQYMDSENISLIDIVMENLESYQNWIK